MVVIDELESHLNDNDEIKIPFFDVVIQGDTSMNNERNRSGIIDYANQD